MNKETQDKFVQLPFDKQEMVEEFVDFLFSKYVTSQLDPMDIAGLRKKNMGWAEGKIWVADDFIEAPIC